MHEEMKTFLDQIVLEKHGPAMPGSQTVQSGCRLGHLGDSGRVCRPGEIGEVEVVRSLAFMPFNPSAPATLQTDSKGWQVIQPFRADQQVVDLRRATGPLFGRKLKAGKDRVGFRQIFLRSDVEPNAWTRHV